MTRTRYEVKFRGHISRFSSARQAQLFAEIMSKAGSCMVEVSSKNGLIGQYESGQPTEEFHNHHIGTGLI